MCLVPLSMILSHVFFQKLRLLKKNPHSKTCKFHFNQNRTTFKCLEFASREILVFLFYFRISLGLLYVGHPKIGVELMTWIPWKISLTSLRYLLSSNFFFSIFLLSSCYICGLFLLFNMLAMRYLCYANWFFIFNLISHTAIMNAEWIAWKWLSKIICIAPHFGSFPSEFQFLYVVNFFSFILYFCSFRVSICFLPSSLHFIICDVSMSQMRKRAALIRSNKPIVLTLCICVSETDKRRKRRKKKLNSCVSNTQQAPNHIHSTNPWDFWQLERIRNEFRLRQHNQDTTRGHCRFCNSLQRIHFKLPIFDYFQFIFWNISHFIILTISNSLLENYDFYSNWMEVAIKCNSLILHAPATIWVAHT